MVTVFVAQQLPSLSLYLGWGAQSYGHCPSISGGEGGLAVAFRESRLDFCGECVGFAAYAFCVDRQDLAVFH